MALRGAGRFHPRRLEEGIINHLATDSALSLAKSICDELGNKPGPALAAIKQLVKSNQGEQLKIS